MNIGCTGKLLDELKLKPSTRLVENPLFSWHAEFLLLNHRKAVLLVNDLTHYCVLLLGVNAQDLSNLDQLAVSAIEKSFLAEGIAPEIIEQYLQALGEANFTSISDHPTVEVMGRFVKEAKSYRDEEFDLEQIAQVEFNQQVGNWDVNDIDGDYECPQETLHRELAKLANVESPVSVRAFQFSINLALNEQEVWRKVIIPGNITFRRLHAVIQTVFSWQDIHPHRFTIFKNGQPVARIVPSQEHMKKETELPVALDRRTMLGDYLPEHTQIKYIYDFDDRWEHYLQIEKTIEAYPYNYPTCIDAKGDGPPEDVGGAVGYNAFLQVLNDPEHPEHEETVSWGKKQDYKEFNMMWVNHSLRYAQYLNRRRIRRPSSGPWKRLYAVK